MKIFVAGLSDKLVLQNVDLTALEFLVNVNNAGEVLNATDGIDWGKIRINAKLFQDNKIVTVLQGNLKPLVNESVFLSPERDLLTTPTVIEADHQHLYKGIVKLGTVLNLRGADRFEIELHVDADVFHASVNTAQSNISLSAVKGIGLQGEYPQIISEIIPEGREVHQINAGDSVKSVVFLNFDKTSNLDADAVIDSVSIESDRYQDTLSNKELIVRRVPNFPTVIAANARFQSHMILGREVDKLKMEVTFNPGNVTNANNYFVYRKYLTSTKIQQRGEARAMKHKKQALAKIEA